jgi:hypothetical protein
MTQRFTFQILICLTLWIMPLVFCDPNSVSSAEAYYYLHVSSYRLKMKAEKDATRLLKEDYKLIVRREHVTKRGYWYRVYIGPFHSFQEAKLKSEGLRKKKLVEYVVIRKKQSLILSDLEKTPPIEKKSDRIEVTSSEPEISPPRDIAPPVPTEPAMALFIHEDLPEATIPPVPIPTAKELYIVIQPLPIATADPSAKISEKPSAKKTIELPKHGDGKNIGRRTVALGLRHTSRQVKSEFTQRTRISSDGATISIVNVSVSSGETEDVTLMHMGSVLVRFGLTDYLEVFAEIGEPYREPSELGFAYGGGLRLNLFEVKEGWLRGLCLGLQGEYLSGVVEYQYRTSVGGKWKKEAEWEEFHVKQELGVARSRFSAYLGGTYLFYREYNERHLLDNLPPSLISYMFQDNLEAGIYGAYGGVAIHLTPAFLLNIEGQVYSQKSLFGSFQYLF